MVFQQVLKEIITSVEGGMAGMVIGRDGIALETFTQPEAGEGLDVQAFGVELVTFIGEISRVSQALGENTFEELSLMLPNHTAILRLITPEYFLVVVISREGNFGKARFLMRRELPRLREEF